MFSFYFTILIGGVCMKEIKNLLSKLGVSPKYTGYKYIIDASLTMNNMLKKNERIIECEVFKQSADKFNTTFTAVEKNIRTCIEGLFRNGNIDNIDLLFEDISGYYEERPSNKLFLMTLINYLNKNKEVL